MKKLLIALPFLVVMASCTKEMPYRGLFISKSLQNSAKSLLPITITGENKETGENSFTMTINKDEFSGEWGCSSWDAKDGPGDYTATLRSGNFSGSDGSYVTGTISITMHREAAFFTRDDNGNSAKGKGVWYITASDGIYKNLKGGTGTLEYTDIYYVAADPDNNDYPMFSIIMTGFVSK